LVNPAQGPPSFEESFARLGHLARPGGQRRHFSSPRSFKALLLEGLQDFRPSGGEGGHQRTIHPYQLKGPSLPLGTQTKSLFQLGGQFRPKQGPGGVLMPE
jgi:hypothetical protein